MKTRCDRHELVHDCPDFNLVRGPANGKSEAEQLAAIRRG